MMMLKIAKFEKVSYEKFLGACKEIGFPENAAEMMYEGLQLPQRATEGSAGYDFHTPCPIVLDPGQTIKLPTGVRCAMEPGWVMFIAPRSSLGFNYRLQLDNTIGVVDSDYYFSDNEGHMFIQMTNHSDVQMKLEANAKIAQGIFLPFGVTIDDAVNSKRNGGIGSTGQ